MSSYVEVGTYDTARKDLPFRSLALGSALLVIASFVYVLYDVTSIVGGTARFLAVSGAALVVATVMARTLSERTALVTAAGLFVGGYAVYFTLVPEGWRMLFSIGGLIRELLALLTGVSILLIAEVGLWAMLIAPGPIIATWYLALSGRYGESAVTGGATLGVFVLTGDAGIVTTLAGVIGIVGLIGFGELERHRGTVEQLDLIAIVMGLMIVLSLPITVVPGGATTPLIDPTSGPSTVEGSLVGADEEMPIVGSLNLSSETRFVIEAEEGANWRTGAYDRYTGSGWIRTGESSAYSGPLDGPEGDAERITQRVTLSSTMGALPAAPLPVEVDSQLAEITTVDEHDSIHPTREVSEGASYTVISERPTATDTELQEAGTDYPDHIETTYTQLPDSVPDRVEAQTDRIVEPAENPYEAAVLIERWLERHKGYSLEVDRPSGDVADAFIFEMDEAYCTYFATAMVAMLRTQDIPARMVVGYASGEQVGVNEWEVRGQDAHAWVEVYFPEIGWVTFDPTPSDERAEVHESYTGQAGTGGSGSVTDEDDEEEEEAWTPEEANETEEGGIEMRAPVGSSYENSPEAYWRSIDSERIGTAGPSGTDAGEGTDGNFSSRYDGAPEDAIPDWVREEDDPSRVDPNADIAAVNDVPDEYDRYVDSVEVIRDTEDEPSGSTIPFDQTIGLALVAMLTAIAGAHRNGTTDRAVRAVRLRWQRPGGSPETDVERAFDRLELLFAQTVRERRPDETERSYLSGLSGFGADERIERVLEIHERARYGNGVDESEADEAIRLVDELIEESNVIGRIGF